MSIKLDPSQVGMAGNSPAARAAELRDLRAEMRADMRIGGEPGITGSGGPGGASEVREAGGFGAILEKTVLSANAKEREATAKAEALAAGRIDDLHGTMITMKEADISLKLVGSVRDKLMDAFHELWRINV
jgi:flagellar hook-basal body complex protein FliE